MSKNVSIQLNPVNSDIKITTREGVPMISSLEIARVFDKRHQSILKTARKLVSEWVGDKHSWCLSTYKDSAGRKRDCFYFDRMAATFLVFRLEGEKASKFTLSFLNRFEQMERYILEQKPQADQEWKEVRIESKKLRRTLTDVIAEQLIPLAKSQGSSNSDKLYLTYTAMINREFLQLDGFKKKKNESYADFLDRNDLVLYNRIQMTLAEQLEGWVESGMYYKDIFQASKKWIQGGASFMGKATINLPNRKALLTA